MVQSKQITFFPNPRCSWAQQNMTQLLILLFDPKTALGFKAETKKHISHGQKQLLRSIES